MDSPIKWIHDLLKLRLLKTIAHAHTFPRKFDLKGTARCITLNRYRCKTWKLTAQTSPFVIGKSRARYGNCLAHNHLGSVVLLSEDADRAAFCVSAVGILHRGTCVRQTSVPSASPFWLRFAPIRRELSARHQQVLFRNARYCILNPAPA